MVGAVPVAELGTVTDIRQEGGGDGLSNIVLVRFIIRGITVCQGHHLRSHMVVNRTSLSKYITKLLQPFLVRSNANWAGENLKGLHCDAVSQCRRWCEVDISSTVYILV